MSLNHCTKHLPHARQLLSYHKCCKRRKVKKVLGVQKQDSYVCLKEVLVVCQGWLFREDNTKSSELKSAVCVCVHTHVCVSLGWVGERTLFQPVWMQSRESQRMRSQWMSQSIQPNCSQLRAILERFDFILICRRWLPMSIWRDKAFLDPLSAPCKLAWYPKIHWPRTSRNPYVFSGQTLHKILVKLHMEKHIK